MMIGESIAASFVLSGVAAAVILAVDLHRRKPAMRIMRSVWILTGLWASWLAVWAYYAFGRAPRPTDGTASRSPVGEGEKPRTAGGVPTMSMPASMPASMPMQGRPRWQSNVLSTLHCGAGCTLADVMGEWFAYFVPVAVGGSLLAGSWVLDYVLALCFGVYFQYAAIRSMEKVSPARALKRAFQADFLSLTCWQAGMYGWMALAIFVFWPGMGMDRTSWTFWFLMQIAMGFGFLFSYPMNVWLIRRGIKKEMM